MKHRMQQLLLAGTTLLFFACASTTPPIVDQAGVQVETGIAMFEKVMLGGVEQTILIRTHDPANPVLLFLHGGPGSPETPIVVHFNKELEKHFIVVNWDQRGAGKSFSRKIPDESFTIDQFIEDTHQLVTWLKQRFNQEKIFLVGHSWGSGLGMYVVQKYPEDFHAYVGTGQIADIDPVDPLDVLLQLDRFVLLHWRVRRQLDPSRSLLLPTVHHRPDPLGVLAV